MNSLKKIFFKLYISYYEGIPVQKGKYFIGKMLYNLFGFAVYSFGGIKMYLNPLSLIDRKIITGEDHDPDVKYLIDSELADGGVYIDIGANIGYFCLLAASKKNVEVLAFEPSPRERNRLYDNIQLNAFTNVSVFPYALSDEEQKLHLSIARDWNPGLNSFIVDLGSERVDSIEVGCYRFDSLITDEILKKVKVIKMDVEGYEMTVLNGMTGSMQKLQNAKFILEINSSFLKKAGASVEMVYDFFTSYGFKGLKGINERTYDETFYYEKR
jgi:FkbM family methyltransferase